MSIRTLLISLATLSIVAGIASADEFSRNQKQDKTARTKKSDGDFGLGITVIRLKWAGAEELAATLRPILPEGVKVVAYPPLNALIIMRDPAGSQSLRR